MLIGGIAGGIGGGLAGGIFLELGPCIHGLAYNVNEYLYNNHEVFLTGIIGGVANLSSTRYKGQP